MEFVTSKGSIVRFDETTDLLARGGEGRIFNVPSDPEIVAKVYHTPGGRGPKVVAMVANPPDDRATPGHVSITWPLEVLFDKSKKNFAGYIMKRIGKSKSIHSALHPARRRKELPHFDFRYLLTVGANLASAFEALHARGYVIGDVNELNALVTDTALVTVVDSDSFQVQNPKGGVFRCNVGREEYTPPELQSISQFSDVDRNVSHDCFGLGVLTFQLLMEGFHPYAGVEVPPADQWSLGRRISQGNFAFGPVQTPLKRSPRAPELATLHAGIQKLFLKCFVDGARVPSARPRASEWRGALRQALGELRTCSKDSGHVYTNHLARCPSCERQAMLVSRAKARIATGPQATGGQQNLPAALPKSVNRSAMSPHWNALQQQWGSVQQQGLSPTQGAALVQQWQALQAQHKLLQQSWAGLSQQQAVEEEQRQLAAAQAVLFRAQQELEEARARQNAEIKPGIWKLMANNPEAYQYSGMGSGAYLVELALNGSFTGRFELNVMGFVSVAALQGGWGYDYRQRVFDLMGVFGNIQFGGIFGAMAAPAQLPQQFTMRFFVQPGPGPSYAAIFNDDRRQWLLQRVG